MSSTDRPKMKVRGGRRRAGKRASQQRAMAKQAAEALANMDWNALFQAFSEAVSKVGSVVRDAVDAMVDFSIEATKPTVCEDCGAPTTLVNCDPPVTPCPSCGQCECMQMGVVHDGDA